MRVRKLLLLSLALVAAVPALAAAAADGVRLDPSFGNGGKIYLPGLIGREERRYQGQGPGEVWPLADGRVLVAVEDAGYRSEVIALLPSGELDTGFGQEGVLRPLAPAGRSADFRSLTVDDRERLIVVGASSALDAEDDPLTSLGPAQVLVQRFNVDGQLDLSFGGGDGTLMTDFGLPPGEPGLSPRVEATGAVLDGSGRIIVRGRRAAEKRYAGKGGFNRSFEALLARLTSDGEVDRSFANEGTLRLPGYEWTGAVFTDRQGGVFAGPWSGGGGGLIRLDSNGRFDTSFGEGGGRPMPRAGKWADEMGALALDPAGRLLLEAGLPSWGGRPPRSLVFKRLLPDGSLDREFGRQGLLSFHFPRLRTARVEVDSAGRFLIAMALAERGRGEESPPPTVMALVRLRPDGSLDRGFAHAGVFPIPLPGKAILELGDFELQGERRAVIQVDRCPQKCRPILVRIDLGTN